jgi:hypothetical protein
VHVNLATRRRARKFSVSATGSAKGCIIWDMNRTTTVPSKSPHFKFLTLVSPIIDELEPYCILDLLSCVQIEYIMSLLSSSYGITERLYPAIRADISRPRHKIPSPLFKVAHVSPSRHYTSTAPISSKRSNGESLSLIISHILITSLCSVIATLHREREHMSAIGK